MNNHYFRIVYSGPVGQNMRKRDRSFNVTICPPDNTVWKYSPLFGTKEKLKDMLAHVLKPGFSQVSGCWQLDGQVVTVFAWSSICRWTNMQLQRLRLRFGAPLGLAIVPRSLSEVARVVLSKSQAVLTFTLRVLSHPVSRLELHKYMNRRSLKSE